MKTRYACIALLTISLIGCGGGLQTEAPSRSGAAPVLKALHPGGAAAGARFNQQPNGDSALAVDCEGATSTTVIVFGEDRLKTVFGSDKLLTAIVPLPLTARPGNVPVRIENEAGKSNTLNFSVQ